MKCSSYLHARREKGHQGGQESQDKASAAAPMGVPTYVAGYGTGVAPVPEDLYVRKDDEVVLR